MAEFEGFVDIGGRRLHARVFGSGPTVVLEPGASGGGAWGGVPEKIAEFATVVMYDRAGAGRSDAPPKDASVIEISDDLHALLTVLQADHGLELPAVLLGWSLTGLSVQYHALSHSDDVAGLVLLDSTPYTLFDTLGTLGRLLHPIKIMPLLGKLGWGRWWGRGGIETMLRNNSGPIVDEAVLNDYVESLSTIGGTPAAGELRQIERSCAITKQAVETGPLPDIPVLVLSAELRNGTPADSVRQVQINHRRLAELWPGGEFEEVTGGSHQMTLDRPDAVVAGVRRVVDRLTG